MQPKGRVDVRVLVQGEVEPVELVVLEFLHEVTVVVSSTVRGGQI